MIGGSYYYPGEDFYAWRAQFEALIEHERWPDNLAKQYAYAYMRDTAHDAVQDIPLFGPQNLTQMLNTYEDRFRLLEDLVRRHMQKEGLLRGSRRRRQPGGPRRRSLLKPSAKRSIIAPTPQTPPPLGNHGRVIRIETSDGQLEEVALPPNIEDLRRRILFERTRALLREKEDGTPAPSAKDIRNRLIRLHSQHRPQESGSSPASKPRETPSCTRTGSSRGVRSEQDFPSGQ